MADATSNINYDPFWKDDINILTNKHRLIEFVPTASMNVDEKLNAITRLLIYAGILLSLIYKSSTMIYIPLIGMTLVYLIHDHYPFEHEQMGRGYTDQVQMPTENNPFMNVLMTDYADNPKRNPAADVELPAVKKEMDKYFAQGLYRDVDDIWGRNNSQRQYYTNPGTTIPNDRDSWMKWCWNTPYTCKDGNLSQCLQYEDVRGHGQII